MRLGEICSDSLRELLRVPAPAGYHFRDVLKPLVDEKTLTAGLKFLGLLWKDKVHEDLIESVNPLSQIEASFTNARGGSDVRYLAFSFRRVRVWGASDDSVLGVVADIVTDGRVLLARELEQVRADSGSQAALLLQLLRADPDQLHLFTSSADVALRKSNAMLTAPGIEQQDLKNKLNGVFRELHSVKGEASSQSGRSVPSYSASMLIEDMPHRCAGVIAGAATISAIAVQLDELINHLVAAAVAMWERVLVGHGSRRRSSPEADSEGDPEGESHRITTVLAGSPLLGSESGGRRPAPYSALTEALSLLTQQTSTALSRAVQRQCRKLQVAALPRRGQEHLY